MKKLLSVPRKQALNPLAAFSLRGKSEELEARAVAQTPLLGLICLLGEAVVWYAQYGLGKTLICLSLLLDAWEKGRLDPHKTYYVNADDSSSGLAKKVSILEAVGIHVLAPGHQGFTHNFLIEALRTMASQNSCRGVVLIIDTLKKFAQLMDKKDSAAFGEAVRAFVGSGGTFLALAHTNKRPGPDGLPIPEGTGDILNDFDCAYLLREAGKADAFKVVEFRCIKSRGDAVQRTFYAYDASPQKSYEERLGSVHETDDVAGADEFAPYGSIQKLIDAISEAIGEDQYGKMDLVKVVSGRVGSSRRRILGTIECFTGSDPAKHKWTFERTGHGKHVYRLLDRTQRSDEPEAI